METKANKNTPSSKSETKAKADTKKKRCSRLQVRRNTKDQNNIQGY